MPPERPIRPIFYDESRRRWSWVIRLGAAVLLAGSAALTCFVVSLIALPLLPHNVLPRSKELRDVGNAEPIANHRQQAKRQFAQKRDKRRLVHEIEREKRSAHLLNTQHSTPNTQPIVAGFYVNWEETSRASLRRQADELTHFFPEWLHLSRDGTGFHDGRNVEDKIDIDPFVRAHHLPILPVINNYVPSRAGAEEGDWSTDAVHQLLSQTNLRSRFVHDLKLFLLANRFQGINIDFEEVDVDDRDNLVDFIRELHQAFAPAGLLVTQDIQLGSDAFDIERLALWNDYVIPMLYDEHSPGDESGAGSIAGIGWTRRELEKFFKRVPASKVVLGLGSYAYDWKRGERRAAGTMTYQSAVLQAKESADAKDPRIARIQIDPKTLNPFYRYFDDENAEHVVWMMDATTNFNQWQVAKPYSPRGVALWYLGAEDPSVWSVIGRSHIAADPGGKIDSGSLNTIGYGRQAQVDFEGEGELLEVVAEPSEGRRSVVRDTKTGLITSETYQAYPSGYVVRRFGHKPKSVVLTFDDGPDPVYTPQILDILKREGVKASFFLVGKAAEENPELVARMWDEGHEIGNHTYTHPNLAVTGEARTQLEITTTQRIIEAVTGHTTTLFRPPFAIDVEPRTGGELKPIILASKLNYIAVGEKNDPQDWNLVTKIPTGRIVPRTAEDIAQSVWVNREAGNVILLHDGGGDRSATVAALPDIIHRFKQAGSRFISVADLRGVSRIALFPSLRGRDEVLVGVDKWVFEVTYLLQRLLTTLFALSVILGITRQVWMTTLAVIQRRREKAYGSMGVWEWGSGTGSPILPHSHTPTLVSVVIAAYNEERVIQRTVQAVLASDYPNIEVIVVDDGSQDGTSAAVLSAFSSDSRVACLQKTNGGKASALDLGMQQAAGEIIVALDADTLFAADAITRLVRHFRDPHVGAVSGNVRVGNARNILTKWQALEYITSQNFDRRAYDLLNCITVVPGAIGAWRKEAIQRAGGYESDTLAEDTDLTWRIRRGGWRILNDSSALAYTEAPETLRDLSKQRFRWAFGTLQNLVKHRDAVFRYGAFGWVALPSLWLFQIVFPAISPVMDLTVIYALFMGNARAVLVYYGLMVGAELAGAAIALRMDRGPAGLLPWLLLQRFVYRQLMYYVILKSLLAAVRGGAVGWGKFERRGSARVEPITEGIPVVRALAGTSVIKESEETG